MKRFIFTERNGIYIIDLQQSLSYIDRAYEFIKETVAHGGSVLFVGTKKQAQEAIAEQATRVGMPYVNQRWLGGMLTNFSTVYKRLQRLKELEEIDFDDVAALRHDEEGAPRPRAREATSSSKTLGGIRDMTRVPSAVWIVDTKKEHIAVGEARKLGIPVVAILDTNCDPDEVDYKIPGNDDAIRSVGLLTRVIADAVAEGLMARAGPEVRRREAGGGRARRRRAARRLGARAPRRRRAARPRAAEPPGRGRRAEAAAAEAAAAEAARSVAEAGRPSADGLRPPRRRGAARRTPIRGDRRRTTHMANFTAADVKRLRDATGAGMMDARARSTRPTATSKGRRGAAHQGCEGVAKRGAERTAGNGLRGRRREAP